VALEGDLGAGLSVDGVADVVLWPWSDADFVVDVPSDVAAASPLDESDDFLPLDDLRSIFAQPEPLKWMVGATNALRIAAPQTGHAVGPVSCTPCITSVRWPLAQTYS
jgi:hypothetical protein